MTFELGKLAAAGSDEFCTLVDEIIVVDVFELVIFDIRDTVRSVKDDDEF